MKTMKMAVVLTAVLLLSGIAVAQQSWQQRDDRQGVWNTHNSNDYNKGLSDGRDDRAHNRSAHPRRNDNDYMNGYRAGYGQGYERRNDHDADDRHPGNWGWNNGRHGEQNVQQVGYHNGYQEGLRYGQSDRGRNKYRPTNSRDYKHGNSGYMASYGDKNAYKQGFQQGFRAGYDRGYYGR